MTKARHCAFAIAYATAGFVLARLLPADAAGITRHVVKRRASPPVDAVRPAENLSDDDGATSHERVARSVRSARTQDASRNGSPPSAEGLDAIDWRTQLNRARRLFEWEHGEHPRHPEVDRNLMIDMSGLMADLAPAFRAMDTEAGEAVLSHPAVQARLLAALALDAGMGLDNRSQAALGDQLLRLGGTCASLAGNTNVVVERAQAGLDMYTALCDGMPAVSRGEVDRIAATVLFAIHDEARIPNRGSGGAGESPSTLLDAWETLYGLSLPAEMRAAGCDVCTRWMDLGREAVNRLRLEYGAAANDALDVPPWLDKSLGTVPLNLRLKLRLEMAKAQVACDGELRRLVPEIAGAHPAQPSLVPIFVVAAR